jgi:membrane fusion protein
MQSQQKQDELLDFQARVNMADRTLSDLQAQQRLLIDEQRQAQLQLRTELGDVDRAIAALEQERVETAARRRLVLTAARGGTVSALNVKLGQTVGNGQTLALLLPTNDSGGLSLQAELYAPSRTSGFVRPGQTVWIRLAAFPYQKFGMAQGEVVEVSNAPIAPQDLPPGQSSEPLYRIRARLQRQTMDAYGQQYQLKAGMALEADVVQDRRSVGELVFEPLFAARAKRGTL